jgi:hypothetical protein
MGSDSTLAILGGITGVMVLGAAGRMYFDNTTPNTSRYVPVQQGQAGQAGQVAGRQTRRRKLRRGNKSRKH